MILHNYVFLLGSKSDPYMYIHITSVNLQNQE